MVGKSRGRRLATSYLVAAIVFLVFLMALFWRLWTPIDGAQRSFGWDAQWEYWGDLEYQFDAYADGELPLWNPYDRGGYPFVSDPQAGILYPGTWTLLAGAATVGEVDYWWIAVKVVMHFWLACFGTWVFLRRRGVHPAACYVGGLAFILSYPFLHNVFSALNWSIAWAPWVLASLDAWATRPTRWRGALVALLAALCMLAGAPASVWYSFLVIAPYAVYVVVSGLRRAGPAGSAERRDYGKEILVSAAFAAGLFLAMVAAQLLATANIVDHTVRDNRNLEFITFSTFGVDDLAALLIPRMLGGNTYLGAGVIIWAALALTAYASPRRLVLAGIAVAGFALALGHHGDFLAMGASAFEPFGMFRRAHRYLYVTQLPIAILAAEGLHELLSRPSADRNRTIVRATLVWGVLAVAIFGMGFVIQQKPTLDPQPLRDAFVLACLASVIAVWLTVMMARATGTWRLAFAYLAVVFVAGDLWFARGSDVEKRMHAIPRPEHDDLAERLEGVPLEARVYDREYLKFRPGIRLGIRDLAGYEDDPLALSRYATVRDWVKKKPQHLGHANVGWLLEAGRKKITRGKHAGLTSRSPGVWQVGQVAPTVMWVDRAEIVDGNGKDAWRALVDSEPGTRAVLEAGTLDQDQLARAQDGDIDRHAVAGRLVELGRNHLIAEIDAPAAGVVVIHETYFPGWSATVDGVAHQVVPANGMFRAILVDAGSHRIVMKYKPQGWHAMAMVSVLGFFVTATIVLLGYRRERRARS